MTLTEGKNREIKRVLEHLRLDVTRLSAVYASGHSSLATSPRARSRR